MSDHMVDAWDRHADETESAAAFAHVWALEKARIRISEIDHTRYTLGLEKQEIGRRVAASFGVEVGGEVEVAPGVLAKVVHILAAGVMPVDRDDEVLRFRGYARIEYAPATATGYHATARRVDTVFDEPDCAYRLQDLGVEADDDVVDSTKQPAPGASPQLTQIPQAALDWITGDDTSASSEAIWAHMVGVSTRRIFDHPHHPADLGRCLRLLEAVPQWRARLPEMASRSPAWAALVARWGELEAGYAVEAPTGATPRTYAAMRAAIEGPR